MERDHTSQQGIEVENGKFKAKNNPVYFLGELFPYSFLFFDVPDPQENQFIGITSMGQKLFWEQGSVVAKG